MGLDMYLYEKQTHEVAYWRKANAIHGWIINHADVIDNGTPVPLTKQDLYDLREVCIKVLDGHTKEIALELLPPTEGFFFGNNEIDEWYWSDVSDTIDKLNTALEQSVDDAMFEYYASWQGVTMTYEPPLEDDIALGKDEEDDSDVYTEPDRMYGDED